MRSLKTVLVAAGNEKRTSNKDESFIALKVLLNVNMPKFVLSDSPIYRDIVSDIFPDTVLDDA